MILFDNSSCALEHSSGCRVEPVASRPEPPSWRALKGATIRVKEGHGRVAESGTGVRVLAFLIDPVPV